MLTHCILEVWLTKSQEELLAWADVHGLDGYLGIMKSMHMQAKMKWEGEGDSEREGKGIGT